MSQLDDDSLTAFVDGYQRMCKRQDLEDVATKEYLLPIFENLSGLEEEIGSENLEAKKSTLAQNWLHISNSSHPYQSDAQLQLALSQMPSDSDEVITFAEFAQLYKCIISTMQMLSICPTKEGRERLRGRVGVLLVTVESEEVGGWQDLLKSGPNSVNPNDDSVSYAPTIADTVVSSDDTIDGESVAIILGEKDRQTSAIVRGYKLKMWVLALTLAAFTCMSIYNLTQGYNVTIINKDCPAKPDCTLFEREVDSLNDKLRTANYVIAYYERPKPHDINGNTAPPPPSPPLTLPFTSKKLPKIVTKRTLIEVGVFAGSFLLAPYVNPTIGKVLKAVKLGLGK